ncbi:serine-rich adhesin for platelets-like isoform X2 [Penaeus chinensis]|uniref:serine-rich adhesin for platelets-like isoform X2 n=1 Tax=Penaeus chinensis TaxID=139456 RepID=UPI001FB69F02|nr:serine-rich adhesin for platelets-like isoform X2 [Penaeus chinensis]
MCVVGSRPDKMRQRWAAGGRWAVSFCLLVAFAWAPRARGHMADPGNSLRMEATPVLVPGPASRRIVGLVQMPLEGSRGAWREEGEPAEGSGMPGRGKRDYSLEDFFLWMASGDGPSEEWQHRPRDTSWFHEITTTTVFLTTTVYTTVIPSPFTPSTILPTMASSEHINPTKIYEGSASQGVSSNIGPQKGEGKDLGEDGQGDATKNGSDVHERPQSDYPQSGQSGNQIPGSSSSKDQSYDKAGKTNYITVTKTITSPPTLFSTRPSTTSPPSPPDESSYDTTDLVRPSIEYPGPSATLTVPSATPSLSQTVTPSLTVNTRPPAGETFYTQPTSIVTFDDSSPTATLEGGSGGDWTDWGELTPEMSQPEPATTAKDVPGSEYTAIMPTPAVGESDENTMEEPSAEYTTETSHEGSGTKEVTSSENAATPTDGTTISEETETTTKDDRNPTEITNPVNETPSGGMIVDAPVTEETHGTTGGPLEITTEPNETEEEILGGDAYEPTAALPSAVPTLTATLRPLVEDAEITHDLTTPANESTDPGTEDGNDNILTTPSSTENTSASAPWYPVTTGSVEAVDPSPVELDEIGGEVATNATNWSESFPETAITLPSVSVFPEEGKRGEGEGKEEKGEQEGDKGVNEEEEEDKGSHSPAEGTKAEMGGAVTKGPSVSETSTVLVGTEGLSEEAGADGGNDTADVGTDGKADDGGTGMETAAGNDNSIDSEEIEGSTVGSEDDGGSVEEHVTGVGSGGVDGTGMEGARGNDTGISSGTGIGFGESDGIGVASGDGDETGVAGVHGNESVASGGGTIVGSGDGGSDVGSGGSDGTTVGSVGVTFVNNDADDTTTANAEDDGTIVGSGDGDSGIVDNNNESENVGSGDDAVAGSGEDAVAGSGDDANVGSGDDAVAGSGDDAVAGSGDDADVGSGDGTGAGSGDDAVAGSGDDANVGSGNDAVAGSGDDANVGSGDDANVGSGDDAVAGSGDDANVGSGDDANVGSGDDAVAGSGDDANVGSGDDAVAGSGDDADVGSGDDADVGSGDDAVAGSDDDAVADSGDDAVAGSGDDAVAGSGDDAVAGSGDDANVGSGDDANVGSGDDANVGSGDDADVGSGDDANVGSGDDANVGSGDDANVGSGDDANVGSGDDADVGSGDDANVGSGDDANVGSGDDAVAGSGDDAVAGSGDDANVGSGDDTVIGGDGGLGSGGDPVVGSGDGVFVGNGDGAIVGNGYSNDTTDGDDGDDNGGDTNTIFGSGDFNANGEDGKDTAFSSGDGTVAGSYNGNNDGDESAVADIGDESGSGDSDRTAVGSRGNSSVDTAGDENTTIGNDSEGTTVSSQSDNEKVSGEDNSVTTTISSEDGVSADESGVVTAADNIGSDGDDTGVSSGDADGPAGDTDNVTTVGSANGGGIFTDEDGDDGGAYSGDGGAIPSKDGDESATEIPKGSGDVEGGTATPATENAMESGTGEDAIEHTTEVTTQNTTEDTTDPSGGIFEFAVGKEDGVSILPVGTVTSVNLVSSATENGTAVAVSPSEAVAILSSSGIESSMSVVSLPLMPTPVTTPLPIETTSVLPSLQVTPPSPADCFSPLPGPVQTPTVSPSFATAPPHVDKDPDDTVLSVDSGNDTKETEAGSIVTTSSSETSSVETSTNSSTEIGDSSFPSLEPSAGATSDIPDTSPTTFTLSTPTHDSFNITPLTLTPSVDETLGTRPSDYLSSTPSSVTELTTLPQSSITATPMTSSPESSQITEHSTATETPPTTAITTSAATTTTTTSVATTTSATTAATTTPYSTTTKTPPTTTQSPQITATTELTTGMQPSPPSPSNNATVPLDQRYWVRTVLEGPPASDDPQLYWASIEALLTDAYREAYRRSANKINREKMKMKTRASNQTSKDTKEPAIDPTTSNPYENYTTITARVRRHVPDITTPLPPMRRHRRRKRDIRAGERIYDMSSGLMRRKAMAVISNDEKAPNNRPGSKLTHNLPPNAKSSTRSLRRNLHLWSIRIKPSPERLEIGLNRRKRTTAENVKVRLHNVTYDNVTDTTELIYTVFDDEEPILAREAVANMSNVDDMEMAIMLDQVVVVKAEEYLRAPPTPQKGELVYWIIGGVIGAVMLVVFVVWLGAFVYKRHKREREILQPDSQAATPRSHLSANAYMGHLNLAYAGSREEKLDAAPVPSTSQFPGGELGGSSPGGSHDQLLIRDKKDHSRHSSMDEMEDDESHGDSPREEADFETTEEEVPDGRRPKSSVPWRRPGRRVGTEEAEEPVYSSPNPANIQYQPSHSNYSRYDTTHSDLTSSDLRCDPASQLMANMLQGAAEFTRKDHGSIFLPPPLLPPPQGFDRNQEGQFIPGTSLPRFLPPPRPAKSVSLAKAPPEGYGQGTPSQIQSYDYDPEAPPIPPRNYTREEAGLPPLRESSQSPLRPSTKDAQVEARIDNETGGSSSSGEELARRPSTTSSQASDAGSSDGTAPNVRRLRRRFHDLLDDAFSLLNGQRHGDKVTPLTTPTQGRKGRVRSAAFLQRGRHSDVPEEQGAAGGEDRRPWSVAAVHASPSWREPQLVGVIPLEESRNPVSAWGDGVGRASGGRPSSAHPTTGAGRPSSSGRPSSARPSSGRPGSGRPGSGRSARSITPVNMPPNSPDRLGLNLAGVHGSNEALDPDTGLRVSDPAVPLIRAIKEELKRFKSTISTESSNA